MRRSQKSKRVSWASDVNLCQVRLFLSEESPSQVGLDVQDHLQAKASWVLHPSEVGSDDNLPPGFEGTHPANLLKNKLSQIPCLQWRCPPSFVLDFMWQVVAGEESKETNDQNKREIRVLEAVYPRPSAIPPNPSLLSGLDDSCNNDHLTPLIPITPIEDEDGAEDTSSCFVASNTISIISQNHILAPGIPLSQFNVISDANPPPSGTSTTAMIHGVAPEALATAYTALSAAMSINDQGNLIDQELLFKFLSDPKYVEKLASGQRAATNPKIVPKSVPPGISMSDPLPVHMKRTETITPPSEAYHSRPFYPPPPRVENAPKLPPFLPEVIPVPSPPMGGSMTKDENYFKRLIQQHGGERQDNILPHYDSHQNHHVGAIQEPVNSSKARDMKPKIMKPCNFFNTPKGCRNGDNCAYQHDTSSQQHVSSIPEVHNSKRVKLDREITGT